MMSEQTPGQELDTSIIEEFIRVSGNPEGSNLSDFLDEKTTEACEDFFERLEATDADTRNSVMEKFNPVQLRSHRVEGRPIWRSPNQLYNKQGMPKAMLSKIIWKGQGLRIGYLELPTGGDRSEVILCDDKKLRCLRNPSTLKMSYGEGYGKLPSGGNIIIDTTIRDVNDTPAVRLQKLLPKF